MRWLVATLLALLGAVALALVVREDRGYVLLVYDDWTVEGSLAFFALLLLALFAVLYVTLRTLARAWHAPAQVREWRARRTGTRAQRSLTRGLVELAEGRWREAEKDLLRFVGHSETPLVNYLAAARAAQLQGAHDRRDRYLQLAHESMPSADMAVGLTQAELQLAHRQHEQALATLNHLRQLAPDHGYVLKLLWRLHRSLGDWGRLRELLPDLRRRHVLPAAELEALEIEVARELLTEAGQAPEPERLSLVWSQLPRGLRRHPELLDVLARIWVRRGDAHQAEQVLTEALRARWSDELVALFGTLDSGNPGRQLAAAEAWLPQHPENPALLMTLARLCLRSQLWGKARSYLEASIAIAPRAEAYRDLGALLERLGSREEAMRCYRAGLELGATLPPTPLPPPRGTVTAKPAPAEVAPATAAEAKALALPEG